MIWEYESLESWDYFWDNETKHLNEYGEDGWELVAIDFDRKRAVFKRPKVKKETQP